MKLPFPVCKQLYQEWQSNRKLFGDIPAISKIAARNGLKFSDVKRAISKVQAGEKIRQCFSHIKIPNGKVTFKDCDELWTKAILTRAKYKCEREGCNRTKSIQAHHIFRRGTFWALRYEIENGIALCVGHHILFTNAAHRDEIGFTEWVRTKRDIPYLESKKHNRVKNDYQAIKLYLENQIQQYKK